jgi:muramoyltetrapeptide carboxypeptidase
MTPAVLRPGDLVALVATSGWVEPERANASAQVLAGWGLRVRIGLHALNRHFYLAGTDAERLADFNDAFRDPEVRAVLCMRGGYGAQRIVDGVDFAAVRADPKLMLGFSDVTALHMAMWCETGLPTVHAPMAIGGQLDHGPDKPTWHGIRQALMSTEPIVVTADEKQDTYEVRVAGRAEGILLGGNLTILASTAGTRHTPDLRGAILLIEAVHEEPYRVDRSIMQLKRAGWLDGIAGVAVGQFTGCIDTGPSPTVQQVLTEQLGALNVPVLGGLPIGHGKHQIAVGLGVPAVLDADQGTLTTQPAGHD